MRKGLGHQDRRRTVPTAHISDIRAGTELVDDAVECWQPLLHQMSGVAGTEEPQTAGEQPLVVGMPADPVAAAERVNKHVVVRVAGRDGLERAAQEHRTLLVGDDHRLLGGQFEGVVVRVVGDVSAGRLIGEPLPHVPLGRSRPLCQRRRREGPCTGHRLVQTQPIAEVQHEP